MNQPVVIWGVVLLLSLLVNGCAAAEPPTVEPATAVVMPTSRPVTPLDFDTAGTEFGNLIRLEAARLLTPTVEPGGHLQVQITWRLLRSTHRDLGLVVRLQAARGRVVARRDATIGGPDSGTSRWPADGTGSSAIELPLPSVVEPGRYNLAITVIDPVSGQQIPVSAEGGLPPVVVESQPIVGVVHVTPPGDD